MRVGEAVVAPESAYRLALRRDEGERRVSADGIAEPLEFPVDAVLTEDGLESTGIEKNIDVFRKLWMRFQPFARLVPPLKMILSGAVAAMMRSASVT